jgi:hypothetical protein
MSEFNLEQELKQRIPSFQRENEDFDQFLEAVGKYLDHIRDKIIAMKYRGDYQNSTVAQLVNSLNQDKANFLFANPFSGLDNNALNRIILRDIVEIYRVKGTKKTIEWLFKAIELYVDIRYAWIKDVDTFVPPAQQDIVPATFIYGRANVYDNGVYFDGEGIDGAIYQKLPIYKENYPANAKRSGSLVARTPYVFLNIPLDEFNRFLAEKNIINAKEFENIIIENFNEIRPINVALIIVVIPESTTDSIPYGVLEQSFDLNSNYFIEFDDPRWVAGRTMDPVRYGEYYTTPIDFDENEGDTHIYVPSREEYIQVPTDVYNERFSSESPSSQFFQVRDHAFVRFNVKTVRGQYQLQHSNTPRHLLSSGTAIWRNFTVINPSVDYTSNVHTLATFPVGTTVYGAGRSQGTIGNWFDDSQWYQTAQFEDMFVGARAIRITKDPDWNGLIEMEVEHYSMMHRFLFSHQMNTRFFRPSTGTQITQENRIETVDLAIPRFIHRHDGVRQGYVFENTSSNRIRHSERLDNLSNWSRTRTTVQDTALTFSNRRYQRVVRNQTGTTPTLDGISQTVSNILSGSKYAVSMFVTRDLTTNNAVNHSFLVRQGNIAEVVIFNPANQTFTTVPVDSTFTNKRFVHQRISTNQYRIAMMFDSQSTDNITVTLLADYNNTAQNRFSIFSGVQLEANHLTTYIPRETNEAVRSGEYAVVPGPIPVNIVEHGTIVVDCTTVNHQNGTLLEVRDNVSKAIRVRVDNGLLKINDTPVHTITFNQDLYQNGMYIAFKPKGTHLQYWIENDNGERNVGTIQDAGLSSGLNITVGTNVDQNDAFNGYIRSVNASLDDFSTNINRVYKSILLQYRTIRD